MVVFVTNISKFKLAAPCPSKQNICPDRYFNEIVILFLMECIFRTRRYCINLLCISGFEGKHGARPNMAAKVTKEVTHLETHSRLAFMLVGTFFLIHRSNKCPTNVQQMSCCSRCDKINSNNMPVGHICMSVFRCALNYLTRKRIP